MKTSVAFACGIPENKRDLNKFISSSLEQKEEFRQDYGLQKIFSTELNENIGVAGLIRYPYKFNEFSNITSEVVIFLKSQYQGKKFGFLVDGMLSIKAEKLNTILIAYIWEGNKPSIYLAENYGCVFVGQIIRFYNEKFINVNVYSKFPESLKECKHNFDIKKFLSLEKIS
jgi:RimJ/RimL family protein N-acetyltransferase